MKAVITELLYEDTPENIHQLNLIYDKDRFHARVYYMNTRGDTRTESTFKQKSLYRFEDKDGNVDIVLFTRSYGISKTNKRYISKKVDFRIRIRDTGVWVTYEHKIRAYMLFDISVQRHYGDIADKVEEVVSEKLAWYRYLKEEFPHFDRSLNYFINHGLYNKKDIIKHEYGFDLPLSTILYNLDKKGVLHGGSDFRKLKFYKPWMINENKFNEKLILKNWRLFHDSLKVAKMLDRKINLRWSKKRLEKEHIDMSMDMVNIIYQYDESKLDNKQCYIDFAEFSRYKLIGTMKELALEGITKRHCVVSYKDMVNNHRSGIYCIGDYTLELSERDGGLYMTQFMGYENALAPNKLDNEVKDMITEFNEKCYASETEDKRLLVNKNMYAENMPF